MSLSRQDIKAATVPSP